MHVDIKTTSVNQLRNTFSHIGRRFGADKPASRYQEASVGLQPTTNFHYRPLWDAERHVYDVTRTAIVMDDWDGFRDPRQYYYGSYTITRSRQQETMEKNLGFVDRRGLLRELPDDERAALILALVPLRHLEWGANLNNCYITGYGYGTAITQAAMFHTMDRLGLAQYASRIGLLLDGNTGDSLAEGKSLWLEHPAWQGLRRLVERMLVTEDWFELFVAQNLVLDGLLHPLAFREYEAQVTGQHGPALSLITEFMTTWFDESLRWVDATVKIAAAESPANAERLGEWVGRWRDAVNEALQPYAETVLGDEAEAALGRVNASFEARVAKLGIQVSAQKTEVVV